MSINDLFTNKSIEEVASDPEAHKVAVYPNDAPNAGPILKRYSNEWLQGAKLEIFIDKKKVEAILFVHKSNESKLGERP